LNGRARGRFAPIVVHSWWSILVRPEVVSRLEGLSGAVAVPTRFKRGAGTVDLIELGVMPGGSIAGADAHEPCGTCGRTAFVLPPFGELRLSTMPTADFARAGATLVVVSERVVERLERELAESEVQAVDVTGGPGGMAGASTRRS